MMVLALGQTVWVAVGEADMPLLVERIARTDATVDGERDAPPARIMPAPAPLPMPLQEF